MDLKQAFNVVLDLANENSLDPEDFEQEDQALHTEALRQEEALGMVMGYYKTHIAPETSQGSDAELRVRITEIRRRQGETLVRNK